MKNVRRLFALISVLAFAVLARAEDVPVPDAAAITTKVAAIGGLAGAAAAIGLSVWIYRKTKAKAGQALG